MERWCALFANDEAMLAVLRGVRERTLPRHEWTHAAHFAAAVCLLRETGGVEAAMQQMSAMIRGYNESVGTANTETSGYHETITRVSLMAAWDAMRGRDAVARVDLLRGLLQGPCGRSDWLLAYWSRERLFSVQARRTWVEPDLSALPF